MAVAAAVCASPAVAQFLDDIIDDAIDSQVEEQIEQAVQEQVETGIVEAVEQQVEADVADTIEQQVEAGVTGAIEQQIESSVADTLEQQVESGVTGAITQQLESALEQTLDGELGEVLDRGVEDVVNGAGEIVGGAADTLEGAGEAAGATQPAATERFAAAVDAAGRAVEREVWVILVPTEHVARIESWGFTIRERQTLAPLDRVLLRVAAPEDRDIAQAALDLALDAPGTLVDFNHVYGAGADDAPAAGAASSHAAMPRAPGAAAPARSIGIIDSAVAVEHGAFRTADIVQKDFVPFVGPRPLRHGTAVASILVGEKGLLGDRADGTRLYAASVFFEDAAGSPAATTASLVAALAWLVGEGVPVVNASLAGPPNTVLEAAIEQVTSRGVLVVAAVGNNGPAGEPLYPAAYERCRRRHGGRLGQSCLPVRESRPPREVRSARRARACRR